MKTRSYAGVLALAAAGMFSFAAHAQAPLKTVDGILVDPSGMTVYTFDKDEAGSGKSVCNGPCAQAWPPVPAPADGKVDGKYGIVTRDDGSKQLAYDGKPLYTFAKDAKPGDKNGDNFKEVWHVVKP